MMSPRYAAAALVAVTVALAVVAPWTGNSQAATPAPVPASSVPAGNGGADASDRGAAAGRPAMAYAVAARERTPVSDAATAAGSAPAGAEGSARGVARAVREATLSSRLAARIVEMPLPDGASFRSGALLVKFDCERQAAEARAAAAAAEGAKKLVDTNEELDKFESIGKNDLAISRSQFEKSRAEADALQSQLKDCNLYAPFSGRVMERLAHNFEAVAASQPLLHVVDTSDLEIELIVPSAWLQWLAEGAGFQFRIDETGQTVAGAVARMTPMVDPVSKTTKIIGRLHPGKGTTAVLPGMSGTARFAHFGGAGGTDASANAGTKTDATPVRQTSQARPKKSGKPVPSAAGAGYRTSASRA